MFVKFERGYNKCWKIRILYFIFRNLSDLNNCVIFIFFYFIVNFGKFNIYVFENYIEEVR